MLYENQIFIEHNHNIITHKWTKYKCTSDLELSYELVICVTCGRVLALPITYVFIFSLVQSKYCI